LLLNGCSSSLKVYSEYDKKVDFSQYKTFSFYEIKEEHLKMKEVNRRRLAMAIELELGMKGIKRNIDNPDLLVNLYSFINRKENVTTTTNQNAVGYYGGRFSLWYSHRNICFESQIIIVAIIPTAP
jgi:hypothetical protein